MKLVTSIFGSFSLFFVSLGALANPFAVKEKIKAEVKSIREVKDKSALNCTGGGECLVSKGNRSK